jgi:hypothetical protein
LIFELVAAAYATETGPVRHADHWRRTGVAACRAAQQSTGKLRRIGAIHSVHSEKSADFEQSTREAGHVEDQNVLVDAVSSALLD